MTLDDKFPISIKHIQHIVERVQARCPNISKSNVAFTIKVFFEEMRGILMNGEQLTIQELMSKVRLVRYSAMINGKRVRKVRLRLYTPKGFQDE